MSKIQLGIAPTSVKLRVKLLNSSVTTGAGLTGLTSASAGLIISTLQLIEGANGEASATTYTQAGSTIETISTLGTYAAPTGGTKIRFKEVDATNHPGVYEIQIADARMSATGDATKPMTLIISISGATNLAQADIEIECRNQAVNLIQILGTAVSPPATAGILDVNLKNIANAAVSTSTAQLGVNAVQAGGTAWASGAITDAVFAAATYPKAIRTATAQSGAAGYIQLDAGASATNDLYVGCSVKIIGGTGVGQSRTIMLYVGATQRAYVDRVWATNPANDSVFVINAGKLTADISNTGVAVAGGAATITLASTAVATNDYYDGAIVQISSGTGIGQSRIIAGYVGSTKVATVFDAWAVAPDNTSVYFIRGLGDVEANVTGVDSAALSTHAVGMLPADTRDLAGQAVTAAAGVTFPTSVASPTNITAGAITTVTNLTNAPTAGDLTAAMKASLSTTTYPSGFIFYDSAAANTNTVIGVDGTPANPVSTPAAAKTLADALGTKAIFVKGTWTNTVTMTGYTFNGSGHTAILDFNGTNMTGCNFSYLDLRGINTGLTNIYNKVTTISTFTVAGVIYDSEIGNTVSIKGYSNIWNCQPTNTGAINLVFGATLQAVNIDNLFTTYATISGLANAGSTIDVMFTGYPDIIIDASCTAGTINLMGFIKSITNNGTATVNDRRTAVSIAGTTDANVVSIDGQLTAGNNATLNLKKLNIVNDAGDALVAQSTGSNGIGIRAIGFGAGSGIDGTGGDTGNGVVGNSGSNYGAGIRGTSQTDAGISGIGGSGAPGIKGLGGTNADGIQGEGDGTGDGFRGKGGTNGAGMALLKGAGASYDLKLDTPSTNLALSGTTDANVVSIDSSAPAAVQLAKSANTIVSATVNIVDFAPTTTEFETGDLTDPAADFYKTRTVIFTSGTLTNQAREIVASSFNAGTGKTHLTVKALTTAPAAAVGFNIV